MQKKIKVSRPKKTVNKGEVIIQYLNFYSSYPLEQTENELWGLKK